MNSPSRIVASPWPDIPPMPVARRRLCLVSLRQARLQALTTAPPHAEPDPRIRMPRWGRAGADPPDQKALRRREAAPALCASRRRGPGTGRRRHPHRARPPSANPGAPSRRSSPTSITAGTAQPPSPCRLDPGSIGPADCPSLSDQRQTPHAPNRRQGPEGVGAAGQADRVRSRRYNHRVQDRRRGMRAEEKQRVMADGPPDRSCPAPASSSGCSASWLPDNRARSVVGELLAGHAGSAGDEPRRACVSSRPRSPLRRGSAFRP